MKESKTYNPNKAKRGNPPTLLMKKTEKNFETQSNPSPQGQLGIGKEIGFSEKQRGTTFHKESNQILPIPTKQGNLRP